MKENWVSTVLAFHGVKFTFHYMSEVRHEEFQMEANSNGGKKLKLGNGCRRLDCLR